MAFPQNNPLKKIPAGVSSGWLRIVRLRTKVGFKWGWRKCGICGSEQRGEILIQKVMRLDIKMKRNFNAGFKAMTTFKVMNAMLQDKHPFKTFSLLLLFNR